MTDKPQQAYVDLWAETKYQVITERDRLRAENERLRAALDALALALTEHHHQWTNEERALYEKASR